jgi:protein-tyrosine kinase
MVIEKALEKMRQANALKAAATPPRPSSAGAESLREARDGGASPLPTLPEVRADYSSVEANRVFVSGAGDPNESPAADAAYRILRARLMQKVRSNRWGVLAFTSPGAGEGKSLTTLNLALNIAREKLNRVFVLDLDMRSPSICSYLGVQPPQELVQYFAGSGSPADVLFSIGVDHLAIAGSTTPTDRASELLANGRLEILLDYIRSISSNALVLVDLPPILVTDEALMIAPRVDATVLVVAEGRTRRDSLARAKQLLSEFPVAGVVLNCASQNYGADVYYGERYGSRYAKKFVPDAT